MAGLTPQIFDRFFDGLKPSEITVANLVDHARESGVQLTLQDLKGVLDTHRLREGAMSLRDWRLLLALQLGDVALKAREAFALPSLNYLYLFQGDVLVLNQATFELHFHR